MRTIIIEAIIILGTSYFMIGAILDSAKKTADEYSSNITHFENKF